MTKAVWRRVGLKAIPIAEPAIESLLSIKDGKDFIAETHAARNPRQLNLYWAVVAIVAENEGRTRDDISDWLCHATNYVQHYFDPYGRLHIIPKSISPERMQQDVFNRFFNAAVMKVCERIGSAPDEVRTRIYELLDGGGYEEMRRA